MRPYTIAAIVLLPFLAACGGKESRSPAETPTPLTPASEQRYRDIVDGLRLSAVKYESLLGDAPPMNGRPRRFYADREDFANYNPDRLPYAINFTDGRRIFQLFAPDNSPDFWHGDAYRVMSGANGCYAPPSDRKDTAYSGLYAQFAAGEAADIGLIKVIISDPTDCVELK